MPDGFFCSGILQPACNWVKEHETLSEVAALTFGALVFAGARKKAAESFGSIFKSAAENETSKVGLKGVDTFVFDFDRTLIKTDKAFSAYSSTLQAGLAQATGLDSRFVGQALRATEERLNSSFFARRLDLIEPIQNRFVGQDLNKLFPDIAAKAEAAYQKELLPDKETLMLLDDLVALRSAGKIKNLAMFTAGSPAHTAQKLEAAGLTKYFDTVFTGAAHPFEDSLASRLAYSSRTKDNFVELNFLPKSDSSGYETILRSLGSSPSRTVMTGDHMVEDVMRSKQAGLKSIWATWYAQSGSAKVSPDFILSSPKQMRTLLKGL